MVKPIFITQEAQKGSAYFQSSCCISKTKIMQEMFEFRNDQQRRLKNPFREIFTIGYHIALPVSKIQLKSIQSILYLFIFTECQPGWTIRGSETSGLSWTQKQKWAKSCTSKGVEGERSWRSHWDSHWNSNQMDIRTLLPTLLCDCFVTTAFNSLFLCFRRGISERSHEIKSRKW